MRPIDADALVDLWKGIDPASTVHPDSVIGTIEQAKPLEMKPVVHAHWIRTAIDYGTIGYIRCSNCGAGFSLPVYKMRGFYQRYCGACGAKMDE